MKLEGVGLGIGPTSAVSRHELSASPSAGASRRRDESSELALVQLRPVLEASGQALIVLDEEDAVAFATSAALGLLGTRADAIEQQPLRDHATLCDSATAPALRDSAFGDSATAPALRGSASFASTSPPLPLLVQARDGLQHVALEAHDGRRFVARLRVLYDRRAAATHVCMTLDAPRAAAPQAPSLEALGRLAAELGHEINNQLAAALNYASIVQRRVGTGDGLVEPEHLEELQQALWRASGWTASLRLVGRQRSVTPEQLSADQVLVELEPLLRHVLGETTLHFDLDAARSSIEVPRAYFEQVVIGMVAHALSRASSPKAITVRTRVLSGGETRSPLVRLTCETHGEHISNTSLAAQRGTARPRGTLRRALKRCSAKLHHDQHKIWADFCL